MAMVASRRRSASAALLCIAVLWLLPVANALDDVRMVRTAWGVDEFERPEQWTQWMVGISELYQGVEVPTWVVCSGFPSYDGTCMHACNATRAALFAEALETSGLFYVAQVHVCGVPIASAKVEDSIASLRAQATLAKELGATMLNVHDGVDIWGDADVLRYFAAAVDIEDSLGLVVAHETHRTRALATPRTTLLVLDAFPTVKLTADLSHWVIAAERAFDYPSDAAYWPPILARVANATVLTHARVGSAEAIQVNDPSAPEHAALVETYERWWNVIWSRQAALGRPVLIEPEFGPAPYLPTAPHTAMPLADLAKAVEYMSRRQLRRIERGECAAPA